ncbi:hypothetical protein AAE478_004463 [Parahypoxylon ruwenzoriense]
MIILNPDREPFLVKGVGIFFGCGHHFCQATESPQALKAELRDHLRCPLCHSHECLACGAAFTGWLSTCDSCSQFCSFQVMGDEAADDDFDRIRFEQGIFLVPIVGDEGTKIIDWTDNLSLGLGYVEFRAAISEDGERFASEPFVLYLSQISRFDAQDQVNTTSYPEPLKIETRVVFTDVIPPEDRDHDFFMLV